eukprot:jgi/Mesen1/2500/ME000159S01620
MMEEEEEEEEQASKRLRSQVAMHHHAAVGGGQATALGPSGDGGERYGIAGRRVRPATAAAHDYDWAAAASYMVTVEEDELEGGTVWGRLGQRGRATAHAAAAAAAADREAGMQARSSRQQQQQRGDGDGGEKSDVRSRLIAARRSSRGRGHGRAHQDDGTWGAGGMDYNVVSAAPPQRAAAAGAPVVASAHWSECGEQQQLLEEQQQQREEGEDGELNIVVSGSSAAQDARERREALAWHALPAAGQGDAFAHHTYGLAEAAAPAPVEALEMVKLKARQAEVVHNNKDLAAAAMAASQPQQPLPSLQAAGGVPTPTSTPAPTPTLTPAATAMAARPPSQEESDARSVFVNNVHFAATVGGLTAHFGGCGTILRVTILSDPVTMGPRGCAYIEFADVAAVDKAVALSEVAFMSRLLKVARKKGSVLPAHVPQQVMRGPPMRRPMAALRSVYVRGGGPLAAHMFTSSPRSLPARGSLTWSRTNSTSASSAPGSASGPAAADPSVVGDEGPPAGTSAPSGLGSNPTNHPGLSRSLSSTPRASFPGSRSLLAAQPRSFSYVRTAETSL